MGWGEVRMKREVGKGIGEDGERNRNITRFVICML